MNKKAWIVLIVVGGLLLLGSCVAILAVAGSSLSDTIDDLDSALENDGGREYMLSQPCSDVMTEYTTVAVMGQSTAIAHVANVYNIKTGTTPYIALSDVRAKVNQCS